VLPGDAAPETVKLLRGLVAQRTRLLETAESNREAAKLLTTAYLAQMAQTYHAEFAPVCAVMGGLIASEVIKLISGKERPINNCLFYDGATSDAMVQRLGPSFDTSWGIDRGEFQPLSARRAE